MFKNRVRTAALAGAIAVATGLSGFSAPAFAVDHTQQGGYQLEDGSAAAPVVAENFTENQLRDLTNQTAKYLKELQDDQSYETIVEHYLNLGDDGFDPSEEAAAATFAEARAKAHEELAFASENIQKARASVKYALEKDQIAEADWKAFVEALGVAVAELNPLIDKVNEENEHDANHFPQIANLGPVTIENAGIVYRELLKLKPIVDGQVELAGDWNIDIADGQYVTREHMKALLALQAAVDGKIEIVKPHYEKAVASNIEAQLSDVLVRQLFLERATAQRDTLRALKAWFSVVERYFELYQNNELVGDTTLRTLYREVTDNIWYGINVNLGFLADADEATEEYFLHWESDLADNDDEDQYWVEKREFALATYLKAYMNGIIWQEQLDRVELLDKSIIDARAAEIARLKAEAERIAKEEAEREAIRKALEAIAGTGETPAPAPGKASSFKLSS